MMAPLMVERRVRASRADVDRLIALVGERDAAKLLDEDGSRVEAEPPTHAGRIERDRVTGQDSTVPT
jgi:hypothetical protein